MNKFIQIVNITSLVAGAVFVFVVGITYALFMTMTLL